LYSLNFRAIRIHNGKYFSEIKNLFMKNLYRFFYIALFMAVASCHNGAGSGTPKAGDTTVTNAGGPDSAANNGILPPSAAPGNANNSSLADTTYKAKDSTKKKSQ